MKKSIETGDLTLGIISGGQLGKMLIQEASKWDINTSVLDADPECASRPIANNFVLGSHFDFDAVYNFGKKVDLLTFEIEHVNIEALRKLKSEGLKIAPDPEILALIQDKGLQKEFYSENNIPTASYILFDDLEAIRHSIHENDIKFPFVQKVRKGGYDGRGVAVINSENELHKLLDGPSVIEEKVNIKKELAIILARNANGSTSHFPIVEMDFDVEANLVDTLHCPAEISNKQQKQAEIIAEKIAQSLQLEGILAIELFVDDNGNVIVNEMAPRPHNSGHHTIESAITSQYQQHLRAILNLPLGNTKNLMPTVMLNLLGDDGYTGAVKYEGINEALAEENVYIHIYGKKTTKPFRKMGHVTILDSDLEKAKAKAKKIKKLLKVKSWEQ